MKTGWPPGLLQDDCRALARWFSSRMDALYVLKNSGPNMKIKSICSNCGSALEDRTAYWVGTINAASADATNTAVSECSMCGADKCCICDMGDDVYCLSCPESQDDDDTEGGGDL